MSSLISPSASHSPSVSESKPKQKPPPSPSTHNPPGSQQQFSHDHITRPLVIGPDSGPESPLPAKIYGFVEHGFGRGSKELGCPTANLPASLANHPAFERNGVYFGWASVWLPSAAPTVKPIVMSVGYNPVYGNKSRTVEVHVIHEFDQDFYGELVKVIVTGFIRPEYNYSSKEALIHDIELDKKAALESLKRPGYQIFSKDSFLLKKPEDELRRGGGIQLNSRA